MTCMDLNFRCQSCGMPLGETMYGTNEDATENHKYCKFCFLNGAFTNPNQTMEEMIESSIANMTRDLGLPEDHATELANNYIPRLKRWKSH
ncbi:MAG: transcriptional regulator [Candidatus Levybacteria bacterium]|nr:transcriptional regulator [Candidatus Levybacteria bacterium]